MSLGKDGAPGPWLDPSLRLRMIMSTDSLNDPSWLFRDIGVEILSETSQKARRVVQTDTNFFRRRRNLLPGPLSNIMMINKTDGYMTGQKPLDFSLFTRWEFSTKNEAND